MAEPAQMKPVYIGGCMRSGTTLLGAVLGGHSQIICIPEARFIAETWPDYLREQDVRLAWNRLRRHPQMIKQWMFTPEELHTMETGLDQLTDYRSLVEKMVAVYAARSGKSGCAYWVDHTTKNVMRAQVLLEIFPDARFIHIIRDGRAAANSMLKASFGPCTARQAAGKWACEVACNYAVQQILNRPEHFFNIHYEDFITDSEASLRLICRFAGIAYEPELAEKQNYAVPANNARSHHLVGKPPDPARINSWQHELAPAEISIVEQQAREMLTLTGYQPSLASGCISPLQKLRWNILAGAYRKIRKNLFRRCRA